MKKPGKVFQCFLFISLTFLAIRCQQSGSSFNASAPSLEEGTAGMVKILQDAYSKIDLTKVQFVANSFRAEQYKSKMNASNNPGEKTTYHLQYAYELLGAGKNEQAILEFENLLKIAGQAGAQPEMVYQIKKLLALAYIRLGEASNCIDRYNDESCLMPIKGKGIYTLTESSRTAIQLYESMLKENPEDYETVWMLNFAYMTLGEYPQKVPGQWLIPEASFKSDYNIPVFPNIAHKIGVNTVGLSGGACVEDFNNDGFLDIIASSWGINDQLRFYFNNGDGTFLDKTKAAGLTGLTGGLNTIHADYNNDGFADVLVLRGAWYATEGKIPNSLLKNNGDGTFTDVTVKAGLLTFAPTQTAAWADFNNDGWLDLFIGNESGPDFKNPCEFYINNKDGTFSNRVTEAGLGQYLAFIKGCTAGDINNDGWPDLYISTLGSENKLLLNNGDKGNGLITFTDITATAGVGQPIVSFPCWMFDFNNDGWEDIFVAGFGVPDGKVAPYLATLNYKGQFAGGHPRLYINNKDNTFTDISGKAGLKEDLFVMGSNFGDLDNDGWLDMYLGTGAPGLTAIVPNKMFRNNKGQSFQDVTTAGGFGHIQKGHGVGFGDFDNDGDQDIFCVIGGAFDGDVFGDAFFLNPVGNQKSWITLKLAGTASNRAVLGARVKVTTQNAAGRERVVYATVSTGSSFGGNSLQLEMGLDDAVSVKQIEVRWPNRGRSISLYNNVQINRFVRLEEGKQEVVYYNVRAFRFPDSQ